MIHISQTSYDKLAAVNTLVFTKCIRYHRRHPLLLHFVSLLNVGACIGSSLDFHLYKASFDLCKYPLYWVLIGLMGLVEYYLPILSFDVLDGLWVSVDP